MMQMFSEAHNQMLASFKLEGEEKYRELIDIREKQRIFFLYMYELWRVCGENNSTMLDIRQQQSIRNMKKSYIDDYLMIQLLLIDQTKKKNLTKQQKD